MTKSTIEALDTKAAARMLGLAANTLEKLRVRGTGPAYYKILTRVTYDLRDLEAWRGARRVNSTSDTGVHRNAKVVL